MSSSAAHLFDHHLFGDWYSTKEVRHIFDEATTLRIWLKVEAALAETEAELGIIPDWAATTIRETVSGADLPIDQLAAEVARTSHPLLPVLRELEGLAGSAGRYVHWGATTQDILDTAIVLQLKQIYEIVTRDLIAINNRLIDLAETHRDTMMIGRTHGVHALPTTLGFKFAVWVSELLRHLERFDQSRSRVLVGQLGGAVGTMAGFGPKAIQLRQRMMERLGLKAPMIAWQAARDNLGEFLLLVGLLGGTLGKIANEIVMLQVTEISEMTEPSSEQQVSSSTMPHKLNPIHSERVVAISRLLQGLASPALSSLRTRGERDWTTWGAEYYVLPEAACLLAAQLQGMQLIFDGLVIDTERMHDNLESLSGLPYAQNLMLKLAESLGRDNAHKLVNEAATRAFRGRRAKTTQGDFREQAAADKTIARVLNERQIREAFHPDGYLREAIAEVDRMVEGARRTLQARKAI